MSRPQRITRSIPPQSYVREVGEDSDSDMKNELRNTETAQSSSSLEKATVALWIKEIQGKYYLAEMQDGFIPGSYKPSVAYPVDEIDQNTMKRLD